MGQQQSISEIAPETQRSHANMLRGSLENIYGFVLGGNNDMNAANAYSVQQSARSYYQNSKQLTAMINPVNNTTTDFFTEDGDQHAAEYEENFEATDMQHTIERTAPHYYKGYFKDDESQLVETVQQRFDEYEGGLNLVVWGRNQMGQLGVDPSKQSVIKNPMSVNNHRLFGRSCEIKQVSCGKAHTMLLVNHGGQNLVYAIGGNKCGQLGIGKNVQMSVEPVLVEKLTSHSILKVACANNSTFAITENGSVFSWGSSKEGVLGLGDATSHQYSPMQIQFAGQVVEISAGKAHAGAIFMRQSAVGNDETCLFMWGSNKYGQLGFGDYQSRKTPTELQLKIDTFNESQELQTVSVNDQSIIGVSCGEAFTIVKTRSGCLYSCGTNIQGQLGQDNQLSNKVNILAKVHLPENLIEVEKIVSSDFTSCLTRNGDLYLWGPTPLGQFDKPQHLQELIRKRENRDVQLIVRDVSIGTSFGLIQDTRMQCFQIGSLFHDKHNKHYDSSVSSSQQPFNFSALKADTYQFEQFACGHDFVVAATAFHQEQCQRASQNSSIRKLNRSYNGQSHSANMPRKYNFVESSIETNVLQRPSPFAAPQGRYGAFTNHREQFSICSSSLSPLRSSLVQAEQNYSRRNDTLNRSAVISGSDLKQANQHLTSLKQLRDSCTPLREFDPNTTGQKQIAVLLSEEHSLQEIIPKQQPSSQDGLMGESQYQSSHYSTMQEDRIIEQSTQLYTSSQQHQTPQHRYPSAKESKLKVPPFNLNLAQNPLNQDAPQFFDSHQYLATLDIMIREKQELQHSLNVEIQKRLFTERELDNAFKNSQSMQYSLDQAQSESQNLRSSVKRISDEKEVISEQLRVAESQIVQLKSENDNSIAKCDFLMAEIDSIKSQLEVNTSQLEVVQKKDQSSFEESIAKKTKEIYDLTVQLGCIKEENYQLNRDREDLKIDFEERLVSQQIRSEADYSQLFEEFQAFKEQSRVEAKNGQRNLESLQAIQLENAAKIKEQEDKIKKLQSANEKLKVLNRKKGSANNSSVGNGHVITQSNDLSQSSDQIASHYTSQGEQKKPQSHEHSFQSYNSRKSKVFTRREGIKTGIDQENIDQSLSIMDKETPMALDGTQRIFNPIETPNDSQKTPQTFQSLVTQQIEKKQRQPSHRNLFKKQQPNPIVQHQPVLQSTPVTDNRQGINRDQGCLQISQPLSSSYSQLKQQQTQRKKSEPGTISVNKNILRNNISKVNQQQVTVIQQSKQQKATPTRTHVSRQENVYVSQKQTNKHSNCSVANKSPRIVNSTHITSYSSNIQRRQHMKQKSISNPPLNGSTNFQLANDESIFDPRLSTKMDEQTIRKRRTSQHNFNQAQPNIHEITLGGDEENTVPRRSASPSTPQIAALEIQQQQIRSQDFTTTQSFVIIESCTNNSTPTKAHPVDKIKQSDSRLQKNGSVSSTSTIGCGVIMSEMRNKLIDIQNNKQYIEQKIQEYEKKLHLLKGSSTSSTYAHGTHTNFMNHYDQYNHQNNSNKSYYYDLPKQNTTGLQYGGHMTKSSSGLLILNNHRELSRR